MYKGYTNEELINLFREPTNLQFKFPIFLDELKEKVCNTIISEDLSETITEKEQELFFTWDLTDSSSTD